jgi:1-pyrroline-5-carboxylate dehydrogenase
VCTRVRAFPLSGVAASPRAPLAVKGEYKSTAAHTPIVDPLNGEVMLHVPDTRDAELDAFVASLQSCPKSGLHNPLKHPERYLMLGNVSNRAGQALRTPEIADFFARLVQRVSPKSYAQAMQEVTVCAAFLENFSGDQVRFLARSFAVSGDHGGQESRGYRWPYGPVALITPFNFPLEIPVLQLMGALFMGNKPLLKVDSKVSVVMEQFLRLLVEACGLPRTDVDFVNADGASMQRLLRRAQPRNTLFTGSSRVAELLSRELRGKVKIEDAGFDWKVLGRDVPADPTLVDYVAWQSDQDAYACSGQKCSAQSLLVVHKRWHKADLFGRLAALAARRSLADLTIGPVLTWTTAALLEHVNALCAIPGAKLLFGGKPLTNHSIPLVYGAIEPTAVYVPLTKLKRASVFKLATTEVFGPVQVVTDYSDRQLDKVLALLERIPHHLTAGVVSQDEAFRQKVLGATVNGVTYSGLRARTTGAPQNHWFGPAGDPRGAGIGSPEAIRMVWSCHREIIADVGPVPSGWTTPKPT